MLAFDDFALERQREFLHDGRVHPSAFACGKPRPGKLVGHLVARRDTEKVGLLDVLHVGDTQRERPALFDVLTRLVVLIDV